jgi:hypothetical protein
MVDNRRSTIPNLPDAEGDLNNETLFIVAHNGKTRRVNLARIKSFAQGGSGNVDDQYIPLNQKGTPNGVATLDQNGKVVDKQLPEQQVICKPFNW